jgi:hypothetical protein
VIAKKLHCVVRGARVHVTVCELRELANGRKLVSSTDGVVAFETFKKGDGRRRTAWSSIGVHEIDLPAVPDGAQPSALGIARIAWCRLGEPDVEAIAVEVLGACAVFLREGRDWRNATLVSVDLLPEVAHVPERPRDN